MEDEKIIDLFFDRSEQAIHELDTKYGKVCHKLSYNILQNKQDAEECVNDAYLGTWNAIPPQRPNPLLTFLCKIVRNLSVMRQELEGVLSSPATVEAEHDAKELVHIIESFLDTLTAENRVIFLRRYWFSDTYADIAERVGLTEKNISVRLTRTRKQLREYLLERDVLA